MGRGASEKDQGDSYLQGAFRLPLPDCATLQSSIPGLSLVLLGSPAPTIHPEPDVLLGLCRLQRPAVLVVISVSEKCSTPTKAVR